MRTPTLAPTTATATTPPAPAALGPVKTRRRPVLIIASVAALLLSALGGVWLWTAATSSVEVVVAKAAVPRGAVIAATDLMVARVSLDPAIASIPASDISTVVGQRAALDISAGGLLTPDAIAPETVPAKGETVVGLSLVDGMLPAIPLKTGDDVRVVAPAFVDFGVTARLTVPAGPGAELVLEAARAAVAAYVQDELAVGRIVRHGALLARLYQPGVDYVMLISPTGDIDPGRTGVARATAITIGYEVAS